MANEVPDPNRLHLASSTRPLTTGAASLALVDPRTPVVVGVDQRNGGDHYSEPIGMMVDAAVGAFSTAGNLAVDQVRVVRGIWPYRDPGMLVAQHLGDRVSADVTTGLTPLGGNEAYDLLNATALSIQSSELDSALVCGAETMRTRRRDKAAGRRSDYLPERDGAKPHLTFGKDLEFWDEADVECWGANAVNFYAMAASANRHRMGLSPKEYLSVTADLAATGAAIAEDNPDAWISAPATAADIAAATADNRMVADPFPKLMTSNVNVDQAAAIVMCSAEAARSAGIDPGSWIFPLAGTGATDPLSAITRHSFGESPSMRIAGPMALDLAGLAADDVDLIDLYSCFPSAVQTAQHEMGIDPERPWTVTGGMTFAGGPFNTYCLHAYARAVELLREDPGTAFLTGNGGWLTKHSFCVLGCEPPSDHFSFERPQQRIDAESQRPRMTSVPEYGVIDAYTVSYGRDGSYAKAMLAVSDRTGARAWATSNDVDFSQWLVSHDAVGEHVSLGGNLPVLTARH